MSYSPPSFNTADERFDFFGNPFYFGPSFNTADLIFQDDVTNPGQGFQPWRGFDITLDSSG